MFTAVALLSLALGIGANTAIFSLLDQVLLRLMPVKNPQELVLLHMEGFHYGSNWGDNALSYPMYRDFQANNSVFTGMFCRWGTRIQSGVQWPTERARGELVSGDVFSSAGRGRGDRPHVYAGRRPRSGWPPGGDAELRLLAIAFRRRPRPLSERPWR